MSFLANWRPGRLLLAWCGYWIALLLALVGPGIPALLRVAKPGGSGRASVSVGDGALKLSVAEGASTVWALDVNLLLLLAAAVVPPLLLWGLWVRAQSRERSTADAAMPDVRT